VTTTEMAGRIEALEATACKHDAERERLHRVIERLSCRLDVAEARCAVLEHDRARRGLLATLALPTDASDWSAIERLAEVAL